MFKFKLNSIFFTTICILFISIFSGCATEKIENDENNPGDLSVNLYDNDESHSIESITVYNVLVDALLEYDSVYGGFNDGLLMVIKDGKNGFIDKTGKLVIPCEYNARPFSEGLAVVHEYNPDRDENNSDDWGFIDTTGNVVIPIKYDWVGSFQNGRAAFKDNGKFGLIDKEENISCPAVYDSIWYHYDETWTVEKGGNVGLIDKDGNIVVPMGNKYRSSEGLFLATNRDKYGVLKTGFMDIDDNWVIPQIYDNAELFHEGLAWVFIHDEKKDSRTNMFIDKTGAVILNINDLGYSYCAKYFSDGLCLVQAKENEKFGFIDKTGSLAIPTIYDLLIEKNPYTFDAPDSFHDGRAIVKKDGKFGMIDTTGNVIVPIIYDDIRYFQDNDNYYIYNGYVVARNDGKHGILDYYTGDIIVPLIYDYID